jgi:hypothetical protein
MAHTAAQRHAAINPTPEWVLQADPNRALSLGPIVADLATSQSTFMVEMAATANILHHASERSMVLLDQIGRGSAPPSLAFQSPGRRTTARYWAASQRIAMER